MSPLHLFWIVPLALVIGGIATFVILLAFVKGENQKIVEDEEFLNLTKIDKRLW